jgi:hypothetical protein
MTGLRLVPSAAETQYYDVLYELAGPDSLGKISGKLGARFLATSNLPRDVLHKIWAIADTLQQGMLDRQGFYVACRLIAHAQSGSPPDHPMVSQEPPMLPIFEGVKRDHEGHNANITDDVISLSDFGNDSSQTFADSSKASRIVASMAQLGLDPLEFIPFQSGVEVNSSERNSMDWTLTETNREKYLSLFKQLVQDSPGRVSGQTARTVLQKSGLGKQTLGSIWELADTDSDGFLNEKEFILAMHLATKCKKGYSVPESLPESLVKQLGSFGCDLPSFGSKHSLNPSIDGWKYSRRYIEPTTEDQRLLTMSVEVDANEIEEEMRYIFESCAHMETDITRIKAESEKRRALLADLDRTKKELQERKRALLETRRNLSVDRISASRDRSQLQSEILFLKKTFSDSSQDVEVLRQSVKELQSDIDKNKLQTRTLELQRQDAAHHHEEELTKIAEEQREASNLIENWNRFSREDEVRAESLLQSAEKTKLIDDMQRKTLKQPPLIPGASSRHNWTASMLRSTQQSKNTDNVGFGISFS